MKKVSKYHTIEIEAPQKKALSTDVSKRTISFYDFQKMKKKFQEDKNLSVSSSGM